MVKFDIGDVVTWNDEITKEKQNMIENPIEDIGNGAFSMVSPSKIVEIKALKNMIVCGVSLEDLDNSGTLKVCVKVISEYKDSSYTYISPFQNSSDFVFIRNDKELLHKLANRAYFKKFFLE